MPATNRIFIAPLESSFSLPEKLSLCHCIDEFGNDTFWAGQQSIINAKKAGGQMKRRTFLGGSGASLMLAAGTPAYALWQCVPGDPGGMSQICDVGIDPNLIPQGQQLESQWCWAACIEMVFTYYGHPISQQRIVQETWGAVVNQPAQPMDIVRDLNRIWQDDNGRRFSVAGSVFGVNEQSAAQDLSNNAPLIVGTMGHAMVLTALRFARNNMGQHQTMVATVRDPWPGRGRRQLSPAEWYAMQFATRIAVIG